MAKLNWEKYSNGPAARDKALWNTRTIGTLEKPLITYSQKERCKQLGIEFLPTWTEGEARKAISEFKN
jgi:hypothetical protein